MRAVLAFSVLCLALLAAACGSSSARPDPGERVLTISAIPDQDPEELARRYPVLARALSRELGVRVRYRPVTDYAASVAAFRTGDLDLVWFGGLTAVQARTQVPGARFLAQRDIDTRFRSVFIASDDSGLRPLRDVAGLRALRGRRFTFGSESSTSGRLMPELFLRRAGVRVDDLRGRPGFSGAHDRTIALVASGTYEAGALNEQVWRDRRAAGETRGARVILRSPPYHDYAWVARPDLDERLGDGFTARLRSALLALRDPELLAFFGAERFVPVGPDDHDQVAAIARELGLLEEPSR